MKVLGQLESAQLENLSADQTPASNGQVYLNISVPSAPLPKIYLNSAWRTLSVSQATATIVQSSGKAVTVNWANGLNQQVNLTDNCLITFSNPVEGGVHTLVVQQVAQLSTGNAPYVYKFADAALDSARGPYQPSGILISFGNERVHQWLYKAGIKPARSTAPSATVAGITPYVPGAAIFSLCVSPQQYTVIGSKVASPFTYYNYLKSNYPGTAGPLNAFGGVTAIAAPAAQSISQEISPDGEVYAASCGTTPFVQSSYVGFAKDITQYPSATFVAPTALAGSSSQVCWHPSSQFVAAACATTPFIYVFPHTRVAFGTKLADPGTLPPGAAFGCAFSPFGDYLAVQSNTTPFIRTYAFSVASGGTIGAPAANPGTLPAAGSPATNGKLIAWRPQGDYIAMAMSTTPFLYVVPFDRTNGTYGTPLAVTGTAIPAAAVVSLQWSPDGQYLFAAMGSGGVNLNIYDFSSQTIGAPITWTTVAVALNDIAVDPNGEVLYFSSSSSPFLGSVDLPTKARSYVKLL